ncbi:hypothetical protein CCP3SC15_3650001 [Gammaproteobacteria bacterium]
MNTRTLYFDRISRKFYDPQLGGAIVSRFTLQQYDPTQIRVCVTDGVQIVDENGIPLHGEADLTGWTTALAAMTFGAAGTLISGIDASDTVWHKLAKGRFTLSACRCGSTYATNIEYQLDIVLMKNLSQYTIQGDTPLVAIVKAGVEPSGLPVELAVAYSGLISIEDEETFVDIEIPGITATGQISIGITPSTGGAWVPVFECLPTTEEFPSGKPDTVRVSSGISPGTGNQFKGVWTLLRLA